MLECLLADRATGLPACQWSPRAGGCWPLDMPGLGVKCLPACLPKGGLGPLCLLVPSAHLHSQLVQSLIALGF